VGRHPTVVILCLGLLLMIGFSLVAEGLGFDVPKGYLYAAIGFSILIELCNQLARRNRAKGTHALGRRQRTAQAVLRLLHTGRAGQPGQQADEMVALVDSAGDEPAFAPEESSMIERVLSVGGHDVRSIMVPRGDMIWLDVADSSEAVVRKFSSGHSRLPLCAGDASNVLGVLHFKDVLPLLSNPGPIDLVDLAREPRYVMETTPVLKVLEELRATRDHMLIVVDEHGVCEGLVTPMDVLTAVGGELPEHSEDQPEALQLSDGSWLLEGGLSVGEAARLLGTPGLVADTPDATLAGCLLRAVGRLPDAGDMIRLHDWNFEVTRRDGLRIHQVHARPENQPGTQE
jgi:CBS domain containing-hemolysin-like protein